MMIVFGLFLMMVGITLIWYFVAQESSLFWKVFPSIDYHERPIAANIGIMLAGAALVLIGIRLLIGHFLEM